MAKTLISSPPFIGTPLLSSSSPLSRHGLHPLPYRRLASTRVGLSFQEIPPIHSLDSPIDFNLVFSRAESLLYTLADAAVSLDSATGGATSMSADAAPQKSGGWFGFISESMEFVLKILKDGLVAVHVPYSYGFAIILLTIIVKVATFPSTKQQVESTLANAKPVWIGLYQALSNVANEGLLTEGFFLIPSLSGPTTIAAQQSGSGISWLLPFVDGHPPLGWHDTAACLVLPVLLVVSQYASMELMKPPQVHQ